MNKILLVIPAYNEGENIGAILKEIKDKEMEKYMDILVIDDFSQDKTYLIAKSYHIHVIRQVFNLGYGAALQTAYKYAVDQGYDYIIQLDGDGQHDLCNVAVICDKLGCFAKGDKNYPDIVIGSRFLAGGQGFHMSVLKKMAIGVFRKIIKVWTKTNLTDPTSGLQGLNRKAFSFYAKYNQFDLKYPDLNMIVQMLLLGFKIEEIPAVMHQRVAGVSMHTGLSKVGKYMLLMMLSTCNAYARYGTRSKHE